VTRILTRLFIVLFQILRAPMVVDPPKYRVIRDARLTEDKPRFPGWWRA
jgi:hypothetical protein